MAISYLDTPAQQQAMPTYVPEPLAAYQGALAAMQGRFDKAYLANKQTQSALASLQVRDVDLTAKQAYISQYTSQAQRIIDEHGGDYGAATNDLDALASAITADGHLTQMNTLHGQWSKVQEERAKSGKPMVDFNMDLGEKPYFNANGTTNRNLQYESQERLNYLKPMKDLYENLKPFERSWFDKYASDPAFFQGYKGSDLTAQRIRDYGNKVFSVYAGTPEGGQRVRDLQQQQLRNLTSGGKKYLHQASAEEQQYARTVGLASAAKEFLDFGSSFEQHERSNSLIHNPEYNNRLKAAAEQEEKQTAQFVTSTQVGNNADGANSNNVLSDEALNTLLTPNVSQDHRDNQSGVAGALSYLPQAALGPLNLLPGVRDAFARDRKDMRDHFNTQSPYDETKVNHIAQIARANASDIRGGAAIAAALAKPGARIADLTDQQRADFVSYYKKAGASLPINQFKSTNIATISPNAVHLPGFEQGEKSYNYALFKTGSGKLRDADNSLPLFQLDPSTNSLVGTPTTLGEVKKNYDFTKPGTDGITANISGFVTGAAGKRLATLLNTSTDRFAAVNVAGQTYYTFAPDQQVTTTSRKGTERGSVVQNFGNLDPYQKAQLQHYKDFMHGRATVPESAPEPIPGADGWRVAYDLRSGNVDAPTNTIETTGKVTLLGPKGQRIAVDLSKQPQGVYNFFDNADGAGDSYPANGVEVTNGTRFLHNILLEALSSKK